MPCPIPVLDSQQVARRREHAAATDGTAKFAAHGERFTSVEPIYRLFTERVAW